MALDIAIAMAEYTKRCMHVKFIHWILCQIAFTKYGLELCALLFYFLPFLNRINDMYASFWIGLHDTLEEGGKCFLQIDKL